MIALYAAVVVLGVVLGVYVSRYVIKKRKEREAAEQARIKTEVRALFDKPEKKPMLRSSALALRGYLDSVGYSVRKRRNNQEKKA